MPGGDRTGPRGEGPRTGRGMGFCRPGSEEKETRPSEAPLQKFWRWGRGFGFGRGFGWGRGRGGGRGRGWRRWFGWE